MLRSPSRSPCRRRCTATPRRSRSLLRPQRVDQRRQHARAAGADRMAERDRSAVDVDLRRIESAARGSRRPTAPQTPRSTRTDRCRAIVRPGARRAPCGPPAPGRSPSPSDRRRSTRTPGCARAACVPTAVAFAAVATTSAAAPSLMPDALPAVTVPSFLNAGFRAGEFSAVVPGRGYSSVVDAHRIALSLRHRHRRRFRP